ncbi:MAG TPA: hypothetical protein ENH12_05025, partial [Proteobacteria bacterium]|nr:hypothetical protein [Pseudomonadota bacterium]
MARIKWEDRKYNGYFTMPGIGGWGKTRTDKDLKRRLAVLGFRSYWRKLELYRKSLLCQLSLRSAAARRGDYAGDGTDDTGIFWATSGLWAIKA